MFNKWFLVYSQNCTLLSTINFRIFPLLPQKERLSCYSLLPVPRQPPIYFFSLYIYLFWPFMQMESYMWYFVTGFFYLSCFQDSFMLHYVSILLFFLFKKHFIYLLSDYTVQCGLQDLNSVTRD